MPARTHAQAPTSLAALVTHGKLATRTPADKVTKHLQSPGVIVRLVLRLVPFVERASARLRAAAALALRGEPSHPSRRGKAPRLGQTPQRWQAIEEEPAPKLFYGASCRSERLGTRTDHWEIEHIITAPAIASRLDTEDMKPPGGDRGWGWDHKTRVTARTHAQAPTSLAALVTNGRLTTRAPADKRIQHLHSESNCFIGT